MHYEALEHVADLAPAGVFARHLQRFERDFAAWMATDDGRFAAWRAQRAIATPQAARRQSEHSPRTTS